MPKELINASCPPYHPIVGWSPGLSVQVAVGADYGRSLFWQMMDDQLGPLGHNLADVFAGHQRDLAERARNQNTPRTVDEEREDAERLAASVLNVFDSTTMMPYDAVWATLDRAGVNEMVRILRRARDQAFGKDE